MFHPSVPARRRARATALSLLFLGALGPSLLADTALVSAGATWSYLDDGSNQGEAWRGPEFVDVSWKSGPAELGYNTDNTEPREATVIGYGPSSSAKYITTYFRHAFEVLDPAVFNGLKLRLLRDDGAIVYLNGTEINRSNMPTGTVSATTLASSAVGSADESTYFESVLGNGLAAGRNVLAVEVHQQAPTSSDVSFNLELIGLDTAPAITVTRGPYLQNAATSLPPSITSAITIRWRTNLATTSKVWFGAVPDALTESLENPVLATEHEVRLSGLLPDARYYYAIGSAGGRLAGGPDHAFFTPPPRGSTVPFRVWVLGDSGTANANAAAVRDAYTAFNGAGYTDLWLMLGDNAYNNGTDAEFQAAVFDMYPAMLRQSPLWSTLGNHEYYTQSGTPYFDIHTFPKEGEAGGVPSGTEKYYSFDYGNVHFICLDSMSSDRSTDGPMAKWLDQDLKSTVQEWTIAFWHHPPYTFGSHNSDNPNGADAELVQMRVNFLPLLEAGGVDLVLGGHSHSYERSYLLNGHYGSSNTFAESMKKAPGTGREDADGMGAYLKPVGPLPAANQGAVYAVAGSSGKATNWWGGSTALVNPNPHPAMIVSLLKLGSMVLDVNDTRLDVKFLSSTGTVDDQFTIKKSGPNAPPTVAIVSPASGATVDAPVTITATATPGPEAEGGRVARVDFYDGASLIGSSSTAVDGAFQIVWSGAAGGPHSLTAEAWDDLGAYAVSEPVAITVAQAPVLAVPFKLTAKAVSRTQINLQWLDKSTNEAGNKIERSLDNKTFTQIGTSGPNSVSYSDTAGISANKTYYYRVRAYSGSSHSGYSNKAGAKTPR